jgi:WD40 repeat protein
MALLWVRAEKHAKIASNRAEELGRKDYISRVNLAYRECLDNHVTRALDLLDGCPQVLRGWEWYYAWHQCHHDLASFAQSGEAVNGVAFSPDSARVASVSGAFVSDDPARKKISGDLVVSDVGTGQENFAHRDVPSGFRGVAFSPDGLRIAAGNASDLVIWNSATGEEEFRLTDRGHHHEPVSSLAFSPDSRRIIAGYGPFNSNHGAGHADLWDLTSRTPKLIPGERGTVFSVAFSPDGREVALASKGLVELCDLKANPRTIRSIPCHDGFVYAVAFSPDGRYLASGGLDRTLRLWDRATGQEIRPFYGHEGFVYGLAFSPDGRWLLSASEDNSLKLWEAASGRPLADFHGHRSFTSCVAFSPDGQLIASGGQDHAIKLWSARRRAPLIFASDDGSVVRGLEFLPGSQRLVSGAGEDSTRGRLKLWDATTGEPLGHFFENCPEVYALALHPDGRHLATACVNGFAGAGTVRSADLHTDQPVREQKGNGAEVTNVVYSLWVWDLETGQLVWERKVDATEVTDVTFSPDGRWLAWAGVDEREAGGVVRLWDAETGWEIRTFEKHTAGALGVAFSPDSRWIASGWGDGMVRIWETRGPASEVRELPGHSGTVRRVSFLPDGRLASAGGSWLGSEFGEVKIWDLATGRSLDLYGHTNLVFDLAPSPDGRRLATGSLDRTVKLWDTTTGEEVFTLGGHTAGVTCVAFSPDGGRIASGSWDRTVRVWDTSPPPSGALLKRATDSAVKVPELPADPFAR